MTRHLPRAAALAALLALAPAARAADNELTPEEKAEGYVLLFDGRSLDRFRPIGLGYGKWVGEDGVIRPCLFGQRAKFVPPGHLFTAREYTDYVLKLDFRVPPAPQ